jgi:hypothetical protein
MAVTEWVLAKLTDDQQLYVKVCCVELLANWSGNVKIGLEINLLTSVKCASHSAYRDIIIVIIIIIIIIIPQ